MLNLTSISLSKFNTQPSTEIFNLLFEYFAQSKKITLPKMETISQYFFVNLTSHKYSPVYKPRNLLQTTNVQQTFQQHLPSSLSSISHLYYPLPGVGLLSGETCIFQNVKRINNRASLNRLCSKTLLTRLDTMSSNIFSLFDVENI